MFIDHATIHIRAGKGGDGCVSFRREKYVPLGGPSGGDGGKGGDIVAVVDTGMNTLMDFRYKHRYQAENGQNGMKSNCYGKAGADLILRFPQGTVIIEKNSGKILADLSHAEDRVILARGGRGGKGNTHYKSSTRQSPDFAQPGEYGQEYEILLELKSIADVGLIGFPNVGKSSLLKRITRATPKIADYPFTTLFPNLGVVEVIQGKSFIMADIPGIIEGASEGVGLGYDFLRHVERTKLILHVLDISQLDEDPVDRYKILRGELERFSDRLVTRKEVVLLNKVDLLSDRKLLNPVLQYFQDLNIPCFVTSAATGEGVEKAMKYVTQELESVEIEPMYGEEDFYVEEAADESIRYDLEDGEYLVSGLPLERLMRSTNFMSYASRMRFQHVLVKMGVFVELKKMGLQPGDTVRVLDYAFEYIE